MHLSDSPRTFDQGLQFGLAASALTFVAYQLLRSASPRTRLFVAGSTLAGAGMLLWQQQNASMCDSSAFPGSMTQSNVTASPADMDLGVPGQNEEERLDEAILETFPASDPISLRIE